MAAYPPLGVAEALLGELAALGLPGIRPTSAEQVHLTLQFVGETGVRELERVKESVERAAAGLAVAQVVVMRLVSLPRRGRARLVAAELEAQPTLLELHRRLAVRLARNARERSAERFLPHMTLGRFASGGGERLERVPEAPIGFQIGAIVLVESVLRPDRAEHRVVFSYPLRG